MSYRLDRLADDGMENMENFLLKCNEQASEISSRVSDLRKGLGSTPVPPALISALEKFKQAAQSYEGAAKTEDVKAIAEAAKRVSIYGGAVGHAVQNATEFDELLRNSGKELLGVSQALQKYIDSDPSRYRPLDAKEVPAEELSVSGLHAVKKSLDDLRRQVAALDQRINKTIHATDRRAAELSESVNKLQADVSAEIKQAQDLRPSKRAISKSLLRQSIAAGSCHGCTTIWTTTHASPSRFHLRNRLLGCGGAPAVSAGAGHWCAPVPCWGGRPHRWHGSGCGPTRA